MRNAWWHQKLRATAQPCQELLALADIVIVRDGNCPAELGIAGIVIMPRYECLGELPGSPEENPETPWELRGNPGEVPGNPGELPKIPGELRGSPG